MLFAWHGFLFSRVYTFGPTFRAEPSMTVRHLSEFWMLEPEIAFANLTDTMNLAEHCVKAIIQHILQNCSNGIYTSTHLCVYMHASLPLIRLFSICLCARNSQITHTYRLIYLDIYTSMLCRATFFCFPLREGFTATIERCGSR